MRRTVKNREIGSDKDSTLAPRFFSSVPDRWSTKFYGGYHSTRRVNDETRRPCGLPHDFQP